jgi:hypothetical protein
MNFTLLISLFNNVKNVHMKSWGQRSATVFDLYRLETRVRQRVLMKSIGRFSNFQFLAPEVSRTNVYQKTCRRVQQRSSLKFVRDRIDPEIFGLHVTQSDNGPMILASMYM